MSRFHAVRETMTNWNRFVTSCIFVVGLLLKVGVPVPAVVAGVVCAALANLALRRRASQAGVKEAAEQSLLVPSGGTLGST